MRILDYINKEEYQEIQDLFSDATGLAAISLGDDGNYISEGSNFTDFCMKYNRGCQKGRERCEKNDAEGVGCYYCHAGLMDFGEDIVIDNEVVGRVIGGQVLPNPPDEGKFKAYAEELGIDPDEYWAAVQKVPVRTEKSIKAAAKLLGLMINKIVEGAYFGKRNAKVLEVIKPEIEKSTSVVNDITERAKRLEEIASRQNILTLNASIEAARAGAAGAGFAVVATQMGEMSKSSRVIYGDIEEDANNLKDYIHTMNEVLHKK